MPRTPAPTRAIAITTVSRTLLDLAAIARDGELERALAQAERLRLYDHLAITDLLARANGHRGAAILARATSCEPKWTRNEWEAAFLVLIRGAGLPEPLVNAPSPPSTTCPTSRTSVGPRTA